MNIKYFAHKVLGPALTIFTKKLNLVGLRWGHPFFKANEITEIMGGLVIENNC